MEQSKTKHVIPKYSDLVTPDQITKDINDFQVLLNQEPRNEWLKENKHANNSKYIPIGILEWLMTSIFPGWYMEVIEHKQILNSISAHVRVFFYHPILHEWQHMDGVGASPMQTDQGAKPMDVNAIKNNSVQLALPIAESLAFKDAVEKLGKLFGKDLNRKDAMEYTNIIGRFDKTSDERISKMILNAKTVEDLNKIKPHLKPEHMDSFESIYNSITAKNGTHV